MDRATLEQRVSGIAVAAAHLSRELASCGLPEPTFEHGFPLHTGKDGSDRKIDSARQQLHSMLDELLALLTPPELLLTGELRNPLLSVPSIIRLGIAEHFPKDGTTVQELAAGLGLSESLVRRLLSASATHHVYYQDSLDHFVHTAASRRIANDEGMRRWVLFGAEEIIPATCQTAVALKKHPESDEPEHSGWSVANKTDLPIFEALPKMPDRANMFAQSMSWVSALPGLSCRYLYEAFPQDLGESPTMVDVGGGLGHISQALTKLMPKLKCVVEDAPDVVLRGQQELPAELKGSISFQPHDFFQEQPVAGADVYLLRRVLHNWSDNYARKIVAALVPALKPGAKIVVNDQIVPEYGESHYLAEREARDYDMYMLALQNGKERTRSDFVALFATVDARFQFSRAVRPSGSSLGVVEFVWQA